LDTLSSVRRSKPNGVIWMRKGSSDTVKADFALDCNNARNALCNAIKNASVDVNDLFIFDDIVQICLWIIDSGCSKHMMGNRALLTNFVETFLGTVRFGNNDFADITYLALDNFVTRASKSPFEDGVDLLTGDRSLNLYTIALKELASNSTACLLAKASSSQSWLWHQCLSYLNFATINNLVKNNLVEGLPKMKFEKDHLCSACEQGKIHRKQHKSKMAFASNKPLYLLHMVLCEPMRVESVKGKRYVLVVVDDYSRYTWVFFHYSKDEASEVIIYFIKKTQVNLQLQVQRVRTDNGTEFKKTLTKFYDEAEAIATACFIQNRLIIHKRFDKTPDELMNKRKPNIKFFHMFGCRCYLLNDYDNVGKLKEKGDIRVFVGYLKESGKSSNPLVSQVSETSKEDLVDLFQKKFKEYFDPSKIMKSSTKNIETSNIEIPSNEEEVYH
nr:hypothetical protein [Tanacetum cinerariifolium]